MLTLHYYGVQAEQKKLELLERIGRHFFSKNKELMPWKVELKRPLIVCLRLISKHYRYYFLTLFSGPNCSPHHQLQKRFTEKGCQSLPIYQTSTILYHFELFGVSRVTGPLDGAEIGESHGSH